MSYPAEKINFISIVFIKKDEKQEMKKNDNLLMRIIIMIGTVII